MSAEFGTDARPNPVKTTKSLHGEYVLSDGAPERIRTSDPQIRSLVLYPAELRAHRHDETHLRVIQNRPG